MPAIAADWYDTPLYYDIIFDQDTAREADFLEAVMELHGDSPRGAPRTILEPACGSGRLVAALARRDHTVSGFDLNPRMLDYARDRLKSEDLTATLWEDRLESFSLPIKEASVSFDLAHCLVSTFKYIASEEGTHSHLQTVATHLKPGGLYVLGLHLTDYAHLHEEHERWVAERDGIHVVCNTHTWPPDRKQRTEKLRTRLRITREEKTWTQETHWQFRTYNAAEVRRLLASEPRLELVTCYDFTYELNHPRKLDDSYSDIILILRKRADLRSRSIMP